MREVAELAEREEFPIAYGDWEDPTKGTALQTVGRRMGTFRLPPLAPEHQRRTRG
jgi:hypothetical protein